MQKQKEISNYHLFFFIKNIEKKHTTNKIT